MIPITKQEKPLRKRSTFSIVFSQRAAGGGIAVLHWKWNGLSRAVLNFEYGLTATAVVKKAAYMLVYEKSGPKGQIEWHRGYEIRLKHQIIIDILILGIFFIQKYVFHHIDPIRRHHKTSAPPTTTGHRFLAKSESCRKTSL